MSEGNEDFVFEQSGYNSDNSDHILNSPITELDITEAINGLKFGKSLGYEEILNEHIKSTKSLFMPLYIKVLNIIFDSGISPDVWLEGKIKPIYKSKGDHLNPDNYRPITVLSCFSKLFTSILADRQKENDKCKRCAAQKPNTSLNDFSTKLRDQGQHEMLSLLSSLPFQVLHI